MNRDKTQGHFNHPVRMSRSSLPHSERPLAAFEQGLLMPASLKSVLKLFHSQRLPALILRLEKPEDTHAIPSLTFRLTDQPTQSGLN